MLRLRGNCIRLATPPTPLRAVPPPTVEHRLTRIGKSLIPVIAAIGKWGERHLSEGTSAKAG
jgi:DNA-binding HxlR family transcriptional regulator